MPLSGVPASLDSKVVCQPAISSFRWYACRAKLPCTLQVNYFPSRFDPVKHSAPYPDYGLQEFERTLSLHASSNLFCCTGQLLPIPLRPSQALSALPLPEHEGIWQPREGQHQQGEQLCPSWCSLQEL